jgi:catechol-2,3-dioxygenase
MAVRRLNHAVLYVNGLQPTVDFYRQTLGFEVRMEIPGRAAFLRAPGSANDHDLGLFEIGTGHAPDQPEHPGLYHLAWEVGTLGDLADARARLVAAGALVGESDHRVSKSLYAKDPSGIEFEVLWRVPPEDWDAEMALDGGYTVPLDWDRTLSRWDPEQQTGAAANSPT